MIWDQPLISLPVSLMTYTYVDSFCAALIEVSNSGDGCYLCSFRVYVHLDGVLYNYSSRWGVIGGMPISFWSQDALIDHEATLKILDRVVYFLIQYRSEGVCNKVLGDI